MKKILSGLIISIALVYLSVKGTDFRGVAEGMTRINYGWIVSFLLVVFVMQLLRTWRWGLILSPMGEIRPSLLFAVTNIGFLAITALPARLGEFGRPYLIARSSP